MPRILLVLLLALSMAACRHDPSPVGKWQGKVSLRGVALDSALELKDDQTASLEIKQAPYAATLAGKWKLDGKNLSLTWASAKLKNVPDALSTSAKPILDAYKDQTLTGTVNFNNENEMAVTHEGVTDVWKRVPEDAK